MIYSLGITIIAGILILAFFTAVSLLARKVAQGEGLGPIRGWRWYPSPLALAILLPVMAILLVRAAPLLLLIPVVIPVLWRNRRLSRPLMFIWNLGRSARRDSREGPTEGRYRTIRDD